MSAHKDAQQRTVLKLEFKYHSDCPACKKGKCQSSGGKGMRFLVDGCVDPPPCDPIVEGLD